MNNNMEDKESTSETDASDIFSNSDQIEKMMKI